MNHPQSLAAGLGALVVASAALAAPLNLVPQRPDVSAGFVSVSYNAVSGALSASGFSQNLGLPGDPNPVNLGGFREWSLQATISNAGMIAGPASLTVRGDYGGSDQLLMTSASLTDFGFSNGKLEFVFGNGGGSLIPAGGAIGVILTDQNMTFAGFTASFSNAGPVAQADSFLIPAPGAAALAAGAGLVCVRRRR